VARTYYGFDPNGRWVAVTTPAWDDGSPWPGPVQAAGYVEVTGLAVSTQIVTLTAWQKGTDAVTDVSLGGETPPRFHVLTANPPALIEIYSLLLSLTVAPSGGP
jgi:hypothetical protein